MAHSPENDKGVIQPTAAISSLPYTPVESMQALRYFYEELGSKIWRKYGFAGWLQYSSQLVRQIPPGHRPGSDHHHD